VTTLPTTYGAVDMNYGAVETVLLFRKKRHMYLFLSVCVCVFFFFFPETRLQLQRINISFVPKRDDAKKRGLEQSQLLNGMLL